MNMADTGLYSPFKSPYLLKTQRTALHVLQQKYTEIHADTYRRFTEGERELRVERD